MNEAPIKSTLELIQIRCAIKPKSHNADNQRICNPNASCKLLLRDVFQHVVVILLEIRSSRLLRNAWKALNDYPTIIDPRIDAPMRARVRAPVCTLVYL